MFSALVGCGAVFNGAPQEVNVTSEPSGAEVWVNGNRVGVTPVAVSLTKRQNHTVTFKMEGRPEQSIVLNRKVKAGYIILDVVCGVIPIVVDAATGSWYGLDQGTLHGVLGPEQLSDLRKRTGSN